MGGCSQWSRGQLKIPDGCGQTALGGQLKILKWAVHDPHLGRLKILRGRLKIHELYYYIIYYIKIIIIQGAAQDP